MTAGREKAINKSAGMPSCTSMKRLPNLKQSALQSLRDGECMRFIILRDEIVSDISTSNSEDLTRQSVITSKKDGRASCPPAVEELNVSETTVWNRVELFWERNLILLFTISDRSNPAYLTCQRTSLIGKCLG